ncbi:hypothetical protein V1L54_21440 [Streptomyces sp. TRM 70361]|uniref:hypothetical protein n=1 Tax=Streptomyces sp. TRM 70361 TaxID=3116553 RepID=UPI002E7AEF09|nr:hypothetical protein [Streptomyces sp. TRM 70361]MEE1941937.1 hypothetical protein [Streptomyces sp. TRM 70361]
MFLAAIGFSGPDCVSRDAELTESDDEEHWAEREKVHDRIRKTISLTAPSGPVAEFLLHIDGDRAWFRWSDRPFDGNA